MEKQTENLLIEIKTEPSDNYNENKNENCHNSSHGNNDNCQPEGTPLTVRVPNIKTGTKLEDAVESSPFRLSGRASFLYQKSRGDLNYIDICGKVKETQKSSNEIESPKYIENTGKVKMISSEQKEIFIDHVEKESGLLFTKFTESFIICQSHLNELQEQNRLRKKSKCCGIPLHLSSHNLKNKKRSGKLKADRYLTSQQVEEISKKYGSVLPVGTPICTSCRGKIFRDSLSNSDVNQSVEVVPSRIENPLQQQTESSDGFFLRPRPDHSYEYYENAHDSNVSSQETQQSQNSQASEASVVNIDRLGKLNEFLQACNTSPVKKIREPLSDSSERTQRRYTEKANECLSLLLETMCPGEEIKADMPLSVTDFRRSSEASGIDNPNVNSRALLQYGSDLTETKIKRLDEIISEVHQNLELDPKFPKDQVPKASKLSIEVKSSSNQSLDESGSSDDEKSEKYSNLKNIMEKMTKESLPRKPGKKGSIWSDDVFGQPGENRYICPSCGKGFFYMSHLRKHSMIHSEVKLFTCPTCGKGFNQKSNLRTHLRTHADEKMFTCNQCDKGFNHNASLQIHMRTHTGEKPFVCSVCNKGFSRKNTLKIHETTHTPDKPYVCTTCGKTFGRRYVLQRHVLIHEGEKPHICERCGRGFSQSGDLQKHIRTHTGEKPYVCTICERGFAQNGDLTKHMKIHVGDKPHVCSVCKRGFDKLNEMQEHKECHSDQLFFACTRCGKEFSQIKELKSHRLSQACKTFEDTVIVDDDDDDDDDQVDHDSDKDKDKTLNGQIGDNYTSITQTSNEKLLFACVKCGKEFSQMEDIQAHKMSQECSPDLSPITHKSSCEELDDGIKQEPVDIIDTSCNTSDNSIDMIGNYEKNDDNNDPQNSVKKENNSSLCEEEENVCATCGMRFTELSMLQDHLKLHFELEKITNSYVTESEEQSNTDEAEKPFKCHLCEKCYQGKSSLQAHIRSHTGERPFSCETCGKSFRLKRDLHRHDQSHSGDRPFACTECSKRFRWNWDLQKHMRIHSGEKPFSCTICGKYFRQNSTLQAHIRTHTGEKPYTCTTCSRGFSQSSDLTKHMRTHTGEKAFFCEMCDKSFSLRHNLQKHMQKHNKYRHLYRSDSQELEKTIEKEEQVD